jgi:hypothetical protein
MDQVYSVITLPVVLDHQTICSRLKMILSKSLYLHLHLIRMEIRLGIQVEVNHFHQTILFSEAILKVGREETYHHKGQTHYSLISLPLQICSGSHLHHRFFRIKTFSEVRSKVSQRMMAYFHDSELTYKSKMNSP